MALVAVGAFDRQVSLGNIDATNVSLNANLMTSYLAERLGMEAGGIDGLVATGALEAPVSDALPR